MPSGKTHSFSSGRAREDREVVDGLVQRRVEAMEGFLHGVVEHRALGCEPAVVLVALEEAADEIEFAQRVGQPAGSALLGLEPAAQQRHRKIGHQREIGRGAVELPVVARRGGVRCGAGANRPNVDVVEDRAEDVRGGEGHMAFERLLEGQEPRLAVWVLRGFDLGVEIGMAPSAPCANTIRLRVRMFAPSTVMLTGEI